MKFVVITGVSTGIGYATAEFLIGKGFHVFGSVRKEEDARRLSAVFGAAYTPLVFDIRDAPAIEKAAAFVKAELGDQNLSALVNNAGISVQGPLMHIPLDDVRYQMEVNFFGLIKTTQSFLPLLGTDRRRTGGPGRLINISSVSGRRSFPFLGPYTASKHALEAISDALRVELLIYGIDVIVIEPGNVKTPIWDKIQDLSIYQDTEYFPILSRLMTKLKQSKNEGLPDKLIAATIHSALTSEKPKTRYLILKNKFINWTLIGLLPERFVDKLYLRRLKKISGE